jgi:hypothetical protein
MVALLCGVFMMSSGVALAAANPSYTACGYTGAAGSPVCSTSSADPLTGKNGIIVKATNIIALVAGVAAVIMIIVSGIKFITSQGDPSSVAEARKTIIYTAVGLVVIVLARTIITYVVSKV